MELRDNLRVLRKRWRLVVAIPLLALLAAALLTARATPQYRSSVKFFVSTPATSADSSAAYTGSLFSQQRVKSYADLLGGQRLAQTVAGEIGLPPSSIQGRVSAQVQPDTVLLTATVTDPSPARAQQIAAAIGRAFPDLVAELERPADGKPPSIRAAVVENPEVSASPVSPRPVRNLGLALVLGLLLGVGLAVGREAFDTTIKSPADLRDATGIATLGLIAFDRRIVKKPLVVQDAPRAPRAEAFRQLRTNLQFVDVDHGLRSLVITSSLAGEAKSTTACNLAITLAQAGRRVLLLEGDLRRPRVADYLGIEAAVGLTSVLIGAATLQDAVQTWGPMELQVLSSGPLPPNPAELLASAAMRDLMDRLEAAYDVVVVDAPPLLPVTDAAVLATMTTGALLCVHAGKTRREQVHRAAQALEAVGATVLGGLLTMVPKRGPDAYYGYGYGYGEYRSNSRKPQLSEEAALAAAQRPAAPAAVPPTATSRPPGATPPAVPEVFQSLGPTPGAGEASTRVVYGQTVETQSTEPVRDPHV